MSEQQGRIIVHVDPDLEPIIPRFLEIQQEHLETIGSGMVNADYPELERLGHTLKGSGAGYGFSRISELGRSIELAAKAKDMGQIRELTAQLEDYLQKVVIIFDG